MASNIKDMTKGSPAKLIFTFALPLMLGNIFQQLYTVVDTAIVGRFVGVEALVRWQHPEWGLLLPSEFIPLFEKNGFITKLDQYVWNKVCSVHTSVPSGIISARVRCYG